MDREFFLELVREALQTLPDVGVAATSNPAPETAQDRSLPSNSTTGAGHQPSEPVYNQNVYHQNVHGQTVHNQTIYNQPIFNGPVFTQSRPVPINDHLARNGTLYHQPTQPTTMHNGAVHYGSVQAQAVYNGPVYNGNRVSFNRFPVELPPPPAARHKKMPVAQQQTPSELQHAAMQALVDEGHDPSRLLEASKRASPERLASAGAYVQDLMSGNQTQDRSVSHPQRLASRQVPVQARVISPLPNRTKAKNVGTSRSRPAPRQPVIQPPPLMPKTTLFPDAASFYAYRQGSISQRSEPPAQAHTTVPASASSSTASGSLKRNIDRVDEHLPLPIRSVRSRSLPSDQIPNQKTTSRGPPCLLPMKKSDVTKHLRETHKFLGLPDSRELFRCPWDGCRAEVQGRSLVQHIQRAHYRDARGATCQIAGQKLEPVARYVKRDPEDVESVGSTASSISQPMTPVPEISPWVAKLALPSSKSVKTAKIPGPPVLGGHNSEDEGDEWEGLFH